MFVCHVLHKYNTTIILYLMSWAWIVNRRINRVRRWNKDGGWLYRPKSHDCALTAEDFFPAAPPVGSFGRPAVDLISVWRQNKPVREKQIDIWTEKDSVNSAGVPAGYMWIRIFFVSCALRFTVIHLNTLQFPSQTRMYNIRSGALCCILYHCWIYNSVEQKSSSDRAARQTMRRMSYKKQKTTSGFTLVSKEHGSEAAVDAESLEMDRWRWEKHHPIFTCPVSIKLLQEEEERNTLGCLTEWLSVSLLTQ